MRFRPNVKSRHAAARPASGGDGENRPASRGFTLVELLVATTILVLILIMTVQITNYATSLMQHTQAKVDSFQEARAGFESMTRKISQAMLNTYWDYSDASGNPRTSANSATFVPSTYLRQSELHFVCGQSTTTATQSTGLLSTIASTRNALLFPTHSLFFMAPLGYTSASSSATLPNLLNESGYFIEFSSDATDRPTFLTSSGTSIIPLKYRFRLKELSVPTESSEMYTYDPTQYPPLWVTDPLSAATPLKRSIADNIIALVVQPMRSPNDPATSGTTTLPQIAPHYAYDSRAWITTSPTNPVVANSDSLPLVGTTRNQLPPLVQVTIVAIDEASAARLAAANGKTMPAFIDPALTGGMSSIFQTVSTPAGISSQQYGDNYRSDLASLEKALSNQHMTYRVFSTSITILQAKWSN